MKKDKILIADGGQYLEDTVIVRLSVEGKLRENIEKIYLGEPHFDDFTHDYIVPVFIQYKKGELEKIKRSM